MAEPGSPRKAARTKSSDCWSVMPSTKALNTHNPIRKIVDKIVAAKKDIPGKPMIPFMLGDPTAFGNLQVPAVFTQSLIDAVKNGQSNGYGNSVGLEPARAAIAKANSGSNAKYAAKDVFIASGCSGALEIAINGMLNPGDNMLVPNPAFPLYEVIAKSHLADVKEYRLEPEKQWAVDVASLEAAIDDRTKCILVNNPSNPCGSVLPEDNLRAILAVAKKHHLPIIADEIYNTMCFDGITFHALAELSTEVPIITAGGIAKSFLVPGWRVGWLMVHDPVGALGPLREAFQCLTTLIVGANTIVQAAIPAVLDPKAGSKEEVDLKQAHKHYMGVLEQNAKYTMEKLKDVPGLEPIEPQGAMYVMVRVKTEMFKDVADDQDFTRMLLAEENVFVLPGSCFNMANYVRIVTCAPPETLLEGFGRIATFCANHRK